MFAPAETVSPLVNETPPELFNMPNVVKFPESSTYAVGLYEFRKFIFAVGVVLRLVKSIVFEAIKANISTLFIKKELFRVDVL